MAATANLAENGRDTLNFVRGMQRESGDVIAGLIDEEFQCLSFERRENATNQSFDITSGDAYLPSRDLETAQLFSFNEGR